MRSSKDSEIFPRLADTFRLLAMASSQISIRRKEAVAQEISPKYRPLCAPTHTVTSLLLGDDIHKEMRDLKEAQNLSGRLGRRDGPRPNYRGRGQSKRGARLTTVDAVSTVVEGASTAGVARTGAEARQCVESVHRLQQGQRLPRQAKQQ